MQFIKLPKKLVFKHNGNDLKLYAAIAQYCRKDKPQAFPSNNKLMKDTGIKSKRTLNKHKLSLEEYGWIKINNRVNKSNIYELPRMNLEFIAVPSWAITLPANAFKAYCTMLAMMNKNKTYIMKTISIRKACGALDQKTFVSALVSLKNNGIATTRKDPDMQKFKHIKVTTISDLKGINDPTQEKLKGIIDPPREELLTPLKGKKCTPLKGKNAPLSRLFEIDLYEVDFVKYAKSKKSSSLSEAVVTISQENKPNKTKESKERKKENFVDDEIDWLDAFAEMGNTIDRKSLRKKNKANLKDDEFKQFLEAEKKGFNGDGAIVEKYVNYEMQLYDFSHTAKQNIEKQKQVLETRFKKEAFIDHPIFEHFKNLTPFQKEMSL